MQLSRQLCCPGGETEFRRQVRSQTEFGNEGRRLTETAYKKKDLHSARKATIGFTRIARRAGTHAAMKATAETSRTMAANVIGSDAPTPKSRLFKSRVAAKAPMSPATKLIATIVMAWPTMRR